MTAGGSVTQRLASKARPRGDILAVAKQEFDRLGFERATIRGIARRAGYSTGAIFANFPGKAALFEAAMGRRPPTDADAARLAATLVLLAECERFIAGFEDDPLQDSPPVNDLLARVRGWLAPSDIAAPEMEAA